MLNYEPAVTIGLDEECRLQARLTVGDPHERLPGAEERLPRGPDQACTSPSASYGSLDAGVAFEERLITLREHCDRLLEEHVIEAVLRPLSHAIAAK